MNETENYLEANKVYQAYNAKWKLNMIIGNVITLS